MAQRGPLPPLRVTVPTLGKSPSQRLSKYHIAFSPSPSPVPVIYQRPHSGTLWIAVLLQLSSLYAAHQWLTRSQKSQQFSVIKFAFLAFLATSLILGFLQRPWKGRQISSSQWSLLFVSGTLLALSFLFRMRGLADVGPLETILAEYAGAVVGKIMIKTQRKVHGIGDAKFRVAIAFLVSLYLLSQGWAMSSCSPLSSLFTPATKTRKGSSPRLTRSTRIGYTAESKAFLTGEGVGSPNQEDCSKYVYILAPVAAGLLSSMQKLLPSSTSLSSLPKKRLQALSYVTSAAVFIPISVFQLAFPMARSPGDIDQQVLWPMCSMIAFGMVLSFYGEFYWEEKLLISPLSWFHYFVTVCCVCLLELAYGSNFSLLGFVVCSVILAIEVRAGAFISGGLDWNSMSEKEYGGASLFSLVKTPIYHIWTDVKTRKIAMFLLLNTSFMVVEFLYGFLSNSLGLISDACHMLFDCAALAIGLYASYISRLPPNSKFHFGYGRFEVLSGYANAVFLILVASLIVLESLERLLEPPEISTESLLVVSIGGLLVNVVGLIFFHEAHHHAHGSGPCTSGHGAHSQKVVSTLTHKLQEAHAGISFPHAHNRSSGSAVVHSCVPMGSCDGEEDHRHINGCIDSEGKTALDPSHSQSKHQLNDDSGDCSHHHNHFSSGSLSHSPSDTEHSHSSSCFHTVKGQPDQHNPFAQQPHLHNTPKHSGDISHDHEEDGHSHHDQGHGVHDTNALIYSDIKDKHDGISSGHGEDKCTGDDHCHHHHHREEGKTSISGHGDGQSRHESGQTCSHDHKNHRENHHGHDHERSHSCKGEHHHDHAHEYGPSCKGDHDHDHAHKRSHSCKGDNHHDHGGHLHENDHDHDEQSDHHHIDHNMEGIFLHILADTLGSVGVVISTLLIKYKGWLFTDPACSIFISLLIVSSVLPLVRNSAELLLQRVPRSAEKRIQKALKKVEEVDGVHDWHKFHVWSYTNTELVGTLRLHASIGTNKFLVHKKITQILEEAGIYDLTLEVEDLEHEDGL